MPAYRTEIQHPWPDNTALGGFFLVITNFILLVGIAVARRYGEWGSAGALLYLMFTSSAYHACRAGFVCFSRFRETQTLDHLAVYGVLLWVTSACIVKQELFTKRQLRIRPASVLQGRVLVFFLQAMVVYYFVVNNPESFWVNVAGFGLPVSLSFLTAISTGESPFYHPYYGWLGLALFGSAVVPYSLCPMEWYDYTHSIWHILSMIAIPFLILGCLRRFKNIGRIRELQEKDKLAPAPQRQRDMDNLLDDLVVDSDDGDDT